MYLETNKKNNMTIIVVISREHRAENREQRVKRSEGEERRKCSLDAVQPLESAKTTRTWPTQFPTLAWLYIPYTHNKFKLGVSA